jgi:hypothetical protein
MQLWLMHSILWASIISAGVALVTTLLIEYFAKPGLEARKDRIIENRRAERAAVSSIRRAILLAASVGGFIGQVDKGTVLPEYVANIVTELSECVFNVYTTIERPKPFADEWTAAAASVVWFAATFNQSAPSEEKIKYLGGLRRQLSNFNKYFMVPKWRVQRRHGLINRIKTHGDREGGWP